MTQGPYKVSTPHGAGENAVVTGPNEFRLVYPAKAAPVECDLLNAAHAAGAAKWRAIADKLYDASDDCYCEDVAENSELCRPCVARLEYETAIASEAS